MKYGECHSTGDSRLKRVFYSTSATHRSPLSHCLPHSLTSLILQSLILQTSWQVMQSLFFTIVWLISHHCFLPISFFLCFDEGIHLNSLKRTQRKFGICDFKSKMMEVIKKTGFQQKAEMLWLSSGQVLLVSHRVPKGLLLTEAIRYTVYMP